MDKSSCIFYNRSFIEDLYPFSIIENDNNYYIKYQVDSAEKLVEIDFNLKNFDINPPSSLSDSWYPIFIDSELSKSAISNNYLFGGGFIDSPNLGIEEVLSFKPDFQNWRVSDISYARMTTDWILTSVISPFIPEYGLMCWSKNISYLDKDLTIENIPYNTIVYSKSPWSYTIDGISISISSDTKLLKKTDNALLILDKDKLILNNNQNLAPNTEAKYFILSDLLNNENKNRTENNKLSKKDILFTLDPIRHVIHIPDGEAYTYFDSVPSKNIDIQENTPSKNYISPVLNNIYRQIYHNLTLRHKKKINFKTKIPEPLFNKHQGRLFKKLCYFLSTHPQVDRTTVSILQHPEIHDIVSNYINEISYFDREQEKLKKVLIKIGSYFKDIADDAKYMDPCYIPKKLIQKYGTKLRLSGNNTLTYKSKLVGGPHLKVSSDVRSLCSKNIKNSIIYNNVKFNVGPFLAATQISANESLLSISSTISSESNIIPLWDIKKKTLINENPSFSTGPDIEIDYNNPQSSEGYDVKVNNIIVPDNEGNESIVGKEISIDLKSGLDFVLQESALAGSNISFEWIKIYGPDCLRFSNRTLTSIRDNGVLLGSGGSESLRFSTSSDESPTIYIKKPGKYIVQCTINTLYGPKIDTINIYITSNEYTRPRTEIRRDTRLVSLLSDSKNVVMIPNIKEFAFGKQGIFWPVYSDLSIIEPRFITVPSPVAGLTMQRRIGDIVKPLGSILNKFWVPYDREDKSYTQLIHKDDSYFKMTFDCNNTIVEINSIILSNLYSEEYPSCEPIYRETFDNRLSDLELDSSKTIVDPLSNKDLTIEKPSIIETKNLTLVSSSGELLSSIILNDKNAELNFPSYSYKNTIYGSDAGENFSKYSSPVICYESLPDSQEMQKLDNSTIIAMNKGYFHPNSGWLDQSIISDNPVYNNRTSILTGDSSKRYCKTFRGLGFNELYNDFIDNKVKIYSSTITLDMDAQALDCSEGTPEACLIWERKENDDHNINFGYRNISKSIRSLYKYNDEYIVSPEITPEGPMPNSEYCTTDNFNSPNSFIAGQNTSIIYTYPKPGPIFAKDNNDSNKMRFNRGYGRTVGNIDIKLNFLNYINPKELVIWLEIEPCSDIKSKVNPDQEDNESKPKDPLYFSSSSRSFYKNFIKNNITNSDIKQYLNNLFLLNDNIPILGSESDNSIDFESIDTNYAKFDPTLRLFLLNQDHVDISSYNNILKFTDNTNNTTNLNSSEFITNDMQYARLKNGIIELQPTLSAPNYSDIDIFKYYTIIKNNKLKPYTLATFNKFNKLPLFKTYIPPDAEKPPPDNGSSTTFTLKIALIGESDKGYVYDRILNTDNILNIQNVRNKSISNIASNSLCSWDLIISNNNSLLNFEDKDALGQIDYANNKPRWQGYNFIGKIPTHLIPPVNIDAPNKSIMSQDLCFYSKESVTSPRLMDVPSLNISPLIYIPSWSIIGELASMKSLVDQMNNQAREIYNYFNDIRRIEYTQIFNKEIFIPKYTDFPTGRSDKALISISKDNIVWFKLEAGIFRYNNCPIVKPKKYRYERIHYLNKFSEICKFVLTPIKEPEKLITFKFKTLTTIISDNSEYEFSSTSIIDNINSNKNNGLLLLIKSRISKLITIVEDLQRQIKQSREIVSQELLDKLAKFQDLLSQYQSLYSQIGPEGLQKDDIIIIKVKNTGDNAQEVPWILSYYTISIDQDTELLKCILFTNLLTLFSNNNSLFIYNNLLSVIKYFEDYIITTTNNDTNSNNNEHAGYIASLNDTRAYSIYKANDNVDIFIPKKELNDNENKTISDTNKLIENLQKELNAEFKKPKDQQNKDTILNLEEQILDKKNIIFFIKHNKIQNKILAKGSLIDDQSYKTILVFEKPIEENSILVIKPEDNRVIVCDTNYAYIDQEDKGYNTWAFVNDSEVLSQGVPLSENNIFQMGIYGTGSIRSNPTKLYSPEVVNYIKDFMSYIDSNIEANDGFSESCEIYDTESVDTPKNQSINRIYLYDKYSTALKKYKNIKKIQITEDKDIFDTLNRIMGYDKYNSYFRKYGLKYILEGNTDSSMNNISFDGNIVFPSNIISHIVYGLKDKSQLQLLFDRLDNIVDIIKQKQEEIKQLSNQKPANKNDAENIRTNIYNIKNIINLNQLEYNKIYSYLDKLNVDIENKTITGPDIFPNIYLDIISNSPNELIIQEIPNDDYYFINIDAEQGCSVDTDKLPKILTNITYECLTAGGSSVFYVDPFRICGDYGFMENNKIIGNSYSVELKRYEAIYSMLPEKIEELKSKYSAPGLSWTGAQNKISDRSFFLNGAGETKGGVVKARYTYLIPEYIDPNTNNNPDGELVNKVKDIFNLNNNKQIFIDFKKIARNMRGVDSLYNKYIPSTDGSLVKSLQPPPGGPIDNILKLWKCYDITNKGKIDMPDNFKWMNLLKYIAFYNTHLIDNKIFDINGGMQTIKTRDEIGLIPYDYK